MPMYEYECEACGTRFEQIQKFSDSPIDVCPKCGERKVQKLLSSPAIQFKGSGWYINDYARKGAPAETEGKTDASGKPDASKDTKNAPSDSNNSSSSSGSSDTVSAAPSSSKDS